MYPFQSQVWNGYLYVFSLILVFMDLARPVLQMRPSNPYAMGGGRWPETAPNLFNFPQKAHMVSLSEFDTPAPYVWVHTLRACGAASNNLNSL